MSALAQSSNDGHAFLYWTDKRQEAMLLALRFIASRYARRTSIW